MTRDQIITGWASAAKALECSTAKLRRLVAAGPLEVPRDADGVRQFDTTLIATLRHALEDGWQAEPTLLNAPGATDPSTPAPEGPASALAAEPLASSPPPSSGDGNLASQAFRLLSQGAGVTTLVEDLEIPPRVAMDLHAAWCEAREAEQDATDLRAAIDLLRQLAGSGWTVRRLIAAWRRVQGAEETISRASQAQRLLVGARRRQQEAEGDLARVQGEVRRLLPHLGWLRLCRSLAAVVEGSGGGALGELRKALTEDRPPQVGAEMEGHVWPEEESAARALLAVWAVGVLGPDRVLLRLEHEEAMGDARRGRNLEGLLAGVVVARGGLRLQV